MNASVHPIPANVPTSRWPALLLVSVAALCTFWQFPYLDIQLASFGTLAIVSTRTSASDIHWTLADVGVALLLLASLLSTVHALYMPAALRQLTLQLAASCFYFATRHRHLHHSTILISTSLVSIAYELRAIWRFHKALQAWSLVGFLRLIDFRAIVTLGREHVPAADANVVFLIFIWLSLQSISARSSSRIGRILGWVSLCLSLACVAFSFSRALYVSVGLCIGLVLYATRSLWRPIFASLIFSGLVVTGFPSSVFVAIKDTALFDVRSTQRLSALQRISHQRAGIQDTIFFIADAAGPANYPVASHLLEYSKGPCVLYQPFNEYITISMEQGVIGLFALLLIGVGCCRRQLSTSSRFLATDRLHPISLIGALACYGCFQSFLFATREGSLWCFIAFALLSAPDPMHPRVLVGMQRRYIVTLVLSSAAVLVLLYICAPNVPFIRERWSAAFGPRLFIDPYKQYLELCEKGRAQHIDYIAPLLLGMRRLSTTPSPPQLVALTSDLRSLLLRVPEEDSAWHNLALLYIERGDFPNAHLAVHRALALCDEDFRYHLTAAAIAGAQGQSDVAQDEYAASLIRYPSLGLSPLWTRLAAAHHDVFDHVLTLSILAEERHYFESLDPKAAAVSARLLTVRGDWYGANEYSKKALATLPNLSGMWELQAEFFLHEEQPKKAELAVKKALYLNPADVHAYEDLILVKIKLNDVDGAYKAARASVGLIEAARTSSSHRATVLYYPDHSEHAGDDTILAYSAYDMEPAFDFARLFALLANKFKAIGNDYLAEVCIQLGSTYPNTHAVNAN